MASINLQGDTSGSISISAPSVAGSNTITLPATTQTLATENALGVRNLIINGDMKIAQRGTSETGITAFGYFTIDRWKHDNYNAGTWTMSQDTDVPSGQGFSKSLKMTCTTAQSSLPADARLQQGYRIEGQHLQHLKYGSSSAESVTLSFWVKTNKTGTYVINLYDLDNSKNIGSQYTVSSADTWEKKTLTFSGNTLNNFDNDNNASLLIEFWFGAGSDKTTGTPPTTWTAIDQTTRAGGITVNLADTVSNYINITGVQLEVGDTATPFEHRPYDMELARCQRYYQLHDGMVAANGNESTSVYPAISFKTEMRATPSLSQSGVINFVRPSVAVYNQSSISVNLSSGSSTGARLRLLNFSGLTTNQIYIQHNSGAYVTLDAEL